MIEDLWYKNAIIYSLDLETFMDGNGDGTGDFEGLCSKLDYLDAMGVDVIWLAPFQPTPNKDNGYDISDYYGVDKRHGSSGDFVEFMQQAAKRGIRVIIDLVINHTSDQHPWFREARKSRDNPFRDWYIWSDKRPKDWNKGMVFPGVQKATWTRDEKTGAYYHHRFYQFQPDLNMNNPRVRAEIRKIIGYWLQQGVSGFRVDAVPFILETTTPGGSSPELRFEYLEEMRNFIQWRQGDAVMLGEANVLPRDSVRYFGEKGGGIHLMFNFFVNQYLFYALATADIQPLMDALEATRINIPGAQWAHFLRNHDELDLGRLSKEQREAVFQRFGPEERMHLYDRGLRRRLSPMLGGRALTELAYSLMFSLPGTPVIRYGDEIGMGDDLSLKERDAVRTPMHWSNERNGGFSTARRTVHPVISEGPYGYQHINVADQRRDPDSLFSWMTRIIRLRKECPEIGWGEFQIIPSGHPQVLVMHYYWKEKSLLAVHNFSEHPQEAKLRLRAGNCPLQDLITNVAEAPDAKGVHHISLDAYGYRWLRAGNLGHLFKRRGKAS